MSENKIQSNEIQSLIRDVLLKEGLDEFSSNAVADGLIHASLRGVDSHGVRLFSHYLSALKNGRINNNPNMKFSQSNLSTGLLDADDAFGHAAGLKAIEYAIKLAKSSGMGSVSVKKSSHFGAASFFGLKIADQDMLGFSFTHSDPLIPPTFGKEPYLGNNPICFTAPGINDQHFCLDMATSIITFNKILHLREKKQEAPLGVGYDIDGIETSDPNKIVSLAPVGGYKGYGLSLMVEILCALLSSMPFGPHVGNMYKDPISKKRNLGHFFMAIDVNSFVEISSFKNRLNELLNELREQERINPDIGIKVAGDNENIIFSEREKNGIPLDEEEKLIFLNLSKEYKLNLHFNK